MDFRQVDQAVFPRPYSPEPAGLHADLRAPMLAYCPGQYFKTSLGQFPVIAVRFFTDSGAMRMQAENEGLSLSRWSPSAYVHLP